MTRIKNLDLLSADMLDDEFIAIFQSIFFLQRIFGSLRVDIKFRFVTAPSKFRQFYNTIVCLAIIGSVIEYLLHCEISFDTKFADTTITIGMIMIGSSSTTIILRNNFLNRSRDSQLFVKLQRVERCLKFTNVRNKNLAKLNTMTSLMMCLLCVLWLIVLNTWVTKGVCPTISLVVVVAGMINYLEIDLVCFIMYFIIMKVGNINSMLQKNSTPKKTLKESLGGPTIFSTGDLRNNAEEKVPDAAVRDMHAVLDIIYDFMDLYQFPIFTFIGQLFVWKLVTVQNLIICMKGKRLEHSEYQIDFSFIMLLMTAIITMLCIALTLCFLSEALEKKLEASRKLCIHIMSRTNEGKSRMNAKLIILLVETRRKATIYDIYTLGTRLPLHLFAITASYTIVLLQFGLN